ncbi:MAG: hypothetical protein ACI9MC_003026 [Kiritimatiellia bacterium]|jgi:hypothetical protein
MLLLSFFLSTASFADDTTVTRLPMADLRALAQTLKQRDRSFVQQEAGMKAEALRLRAEAQDVGLTYRERCSSMADRSQDAALEVRCQHLQEQHTSLRVEDLRLQAQAWQMEVDHLQRTQPDVERLAAGALPKARSSDPRSQAPATADTSLGTGAAVVLFGNEKSSRLAGKYLTDLQAIPAAIDAKIQRAAASAGVKEPQHMAVALAARAAKGRVVAKELARGASELLRIADMMEMGTALDPDGVGIIDLGDFIDPIEGGVGSDPFGVGVDLGPEPELDASSRRW